MVSARCNNPHDLTFIAMLSKNHTTIDDGAPMSKIIVYGFR